MIRYVFAAVFAVAAVVLLALAVTQHRGGRSTRASLTLAVVGAVASLFAAAGLALGFG